MIGVTILGNNSALPAHGRHPTSQVVQASDHQFLIDCGEGTLFQLNKYKIRRSKFNHIFISHLHGDHYFGLIGLINSYGLNNREADLHIYSPKGLKEIIEIQLETAHVQLPFGLHFHILEEEGIILKEDTITVSAFKVNHRIPCFGFLFQEVRNPRKLNIGQVKKYNVPVSFYESLHQGADFVLPDGQVIPNKDLTVARTPGKTYAYCADTAYMEAICEHIKGADLVYHESTYLKDKEERAADRFHSTTVQAATIAKKANVKRLLIGHYSSMYEDISPFQEEARVIFTNTEATIEGTCYRA